MLMRSCALQGGDTILLQGRNFGPIVTDIVVRYGSVGRSFFALSCSFVPAVVSNVTDAAVVVDTLTQQLSCLSSAGVGKDLAWAVTVKNQTSRLFVRSVGTSAISQTQSQAQVRLDWAATDVAQSALPIATLAVVLCAAL
jgi:hypothetical protein